MASIGKKILSAFVEISGEEKTPPSQQAESVPEYHDTGKQYTTAAAGNAKFAQYFEKLFRDANLPGPDYFEFSKMIEAMSTIPDEKARYSAAFAGLSVQGLDKLKLLSTANEYLRILNTDASNFNSTVDAALQEKVHAKQKEINDKTARIQQLTKEIEQLQQQITGLYQEIRENEEKIENNSGGYKTESANMKTRIEKDIEKIKQHIH
jgi:peptidoglycan hydrolase CwlO-like protein